MYFLSCVEIKTISILLLLLLLLLLCMDFIHASFEAKTVILIDVGLESVGIIKPVWWSLATNQFGLIGRFHTYRDRLSVFDG